MSSRLRHLLAYACLLAVLAAVSPLRQVGDGGEYVDMAQALAALRMPSIDSSVHFFFYSALAAPLVRLATAVGVTPLAAFLVLNAALLLLAFWVVVTRLGPATAWLMLASPVLWWLDKAHTEPFTVSLLCIALTMLPERPWWTMVAFGIASSQNLPFAVPLPIVAVASLWRCPAWFFDRRWWAGAMAGALVPALTILSNLRRYHAVTPALPGQYYHLPGLPEYGVLLWDPNLGLLVNVPFLVPLLAVLVWLIWRSEPKRLRAPEVLASGLCFAAFLYSTAQAGNANHGGTPGMSRYDLWFIPLAIPLIFHARQTASRCATDRLLVPVAAFSVVWSIVFFQPRIPESAGAPTRLAAYLWTSHPTWNNPLAEVFVERFQGDGQNWVPVATAGCEKVLFPARDARWAVWPFPCPPVPIPPYCRINGLYCYANRTASGYDFVQAPMRAKEVFKLRRDRPWGLDEQQLAGQVFAEFGFDGLRAAPHRIASAAHVGEMQAYGRGASLIVCLRAVGPGATLRLDVPAPASVTMVDLSGHQRLPLGQVGAGLQELAVPEAAGDLLLVLGASSPQR